MRVLFTPLSGVGHAYPMVPLAWALRAAGHDVTFFAGRNIDIERAGFPVVDPPLPVQTTVEEELPRIREEAPQLLESMAHLTDEEILALKPMAIAPWTRFVDPIVEAALEVRPDLIVYDPVFPAGLITASLLDVPAVGHGYMLLRVTPELAREAAAPAFERWGAELPKKIATLEVGPRSLMEPGESTWHSRFVPYNGGGQLPAWLHEPIGRPRVAVTLGTVAPVTTGTGRFTRILDQISGIDAEFALTMTAEAATALGPLPGNVRITGWVPLLQLLRTCSAVIHHGGSGTMFTSCVAGLPQMSVPAGADNDYNARRLAEYGSGLLRLADDVDAAAIEQLLIDDTLRRAARQLAAEMAQERTPAQLVNDITALLAS